MKDVLVLFASNPDRDSFNQILKILDREIVSYDFKLASAHKTPEDVDKGLKNQKGTTLLVLNSVCGCAAANARPGIKLALQNDKIPTKLYTVFASMDREAIEESVYKIENEDLNLIGTAEQSLLAMHSDDVLKEIELPKKYFSYSMCFRKEIGSHGINEKGLWRTHQFNKIEQFIFCKPEDSEKFYDELMKNSEEILKV